MPQVREIHLYPVKSLRGFAVPAAEIDALGFVGDRRFLVVDRDGNFVTQRTLPRMALIATELSNDLLTLSAGGAGRITVRRAPDPTAPLRTVAVWNDRGLLAEDCGDGPAAFLSDFLGSALRLVRIGPRFERPVKPAKARAGDLVSFADAYPFLLLSTASLAQLNDRLAARGEEAVPIDRFRPNIVVSGCDPHAEDTWTRFCAGSVVFRQAGPCARCVITTTDQLTGERGKEPLRTLANYRRDPLDPSSVNFGVNLIHEGAGGAIRVGDTLTFA